MAPPSTTSVKPLGILADGFLRLRRGLCCDDKRLAFSYRRQEFVPSYGVRRCLLPSIMLVVCNRLGEFVRLGMHV